MGLLTSELGLNELDVVAAEGSAGDGREKGERDDGEHCVVVVGGLWG